MGNAIKLRGVEKQRITRFNFGLPHSKTNP